MSERLSAMDASFWFMESATTPMHVGNIGIFEGPVAGFELGKLHKLIVERIAFVPRYRQRIREVPLQIGRPIWVDDDHFDLSYHVRGLALAKPGSRLQLDELVSRLMSRPLDRTRPLWEMSLISGLTGGRFAIVTKTHQAMIDGLMGIDISQVILDEDAQKSSPDSIGSWRPAPEPSGFELVTSAVSESLAHPYVAFGVARSAFKGVTSFASNLGRKSLGVAAAAVSFARVAAEPAMTVTALNVPILADRRLATGDFELSAFKDVRNKLGGSVNDIVLAVIAGALRTWLMGRGEPMSARSQLRAVVPISTESTESTAGAASTIGPVSAFLVDLPVGEPDPVVRLHHISYQLAQYQDISHLIGAETMINMASYGPPTLHALGVRMASNLSSRLYNVAVVNVPGPQHPVYVAGARLIGSYPIMPLPQNQALSISLMSYDGYLCFGINADRAAIKDVESLMGCLRESLEESTQVANVRGDRHLRAIDKGKGVK
ncbi:MAG: wax ester/triacylglycerol synthase family O-acyltransferase [Actinobacteria bacterium]|nr:MAG: wax ester/triacylglycerol synthase family O-acyltransferase [Actinomycetota bacterium]